MVIDNFDELYEKTQETVRIIKCESFPSLSERSAFPTSVFNNIIAHFSLNWLTLSKLERGV